MTEINQIRDDLKFVREAVARHDPPPARNAGIYLVWAVYVLVGYTMLDFSPVLASWFFLLGGVLGGVATAVIGRRSAQRDGEYDRAEVRKASLHWFGGIVLAIAAAVALAMVVPGLRGQAMGQLIVVMIGLVYFLSGVHFDRNFLWLGPVLVVGGVLVGFVPRFGWTGLGIVIALGLVVPTFFPPRRSAVASPQGSSL